MHSFTPISALLGGILIGASALLLFWLNGRLAGISTISGKLFLFNKGEIAWRVVFLAGLIGGAALYYAFKDDAPIARANFPPDLLIISGLLVGFGTSQANGCTSGHGVCGLARFSLRSFVATATFLLTGIITTYIVRHLFNIY